MAPEIGGAQDSGIELSGVRRERFVVVGYHKAGLSRCARAEACVRPTSRLNDLHLDAEGLKFVKTPLLKTLRAQIS